MTEPSEELRLAKLHHAEVVEAQGWGSAAAHDAGTTVLAAERLAAAATGDEYAEVIDFGPASDAGAPVATRPCQ